MDNELKAAILITLKDQMVAAVQTALVCVATISDVDES